MSWLYLKKIISFEVYHTACSKVHRRNAYRNYLVNVNDFK